MNQAHQRMCAQTPVGWAVSVHLFNAVSFFIEFGSSLSMLFETNNLNLKTLKKTK